jgi:membrane fusion protein (multidrug efflux system)
MKRKILFAVILVLLVAGGLAGIKTLQIRKLMAAGDNAAYPPETISSAVALEERWQGTVNAIASVAAVQGVNVTAEVPGVVREIAFESGAPVAAGDLLVRLDTGAEEAQLRAMEAQADLARINAERARKLRADNMISESEMNAADATLKQSQANADTIRATIAKKTLRAPFAGRLGIRLVNLGEYLDAGKAIVSLQALDTVYADFSLPQQELSQLKPGMPVRLTTDTYPGRRFEGTLSSLNPDLDTTTRSIRLQATFENPGHLLRPGMFARAEVLLGGDQQVLSIPATAVFSAPYGDSVYVVEPSTNKAGALVVRQQFIRTGRVRGDFVSVEAGLKAGERVASSGLFKLRNGMSVVENNELAPKAEKAPQPSNS